MSFAVVPSPDVRTRAELADLCNRMGIRIAVEVGTDMAVFACQFLDRFKGEILICVDNYEPYGEMPYDRTGDLMVAVQALARHHGRVKLVKASTPDAAIHRHLPTWYRIGFVYIDGDHTYEAVRADIAAWWEVVDEGGVLAGHDYCDAHPGVKRAVEEFARSRGLQVRVTRDSPASWYVLKRSVKP